ncbi:Rare lipoprotein A precursor [Providencia rustigianii]|nr:MULTISPECIES: endolytic peptidoglycan transglycosylase RlpA [Providencia]MTC58121.1 endolytic peptidoglycan transglycosylase RlpA [Providencia rustigianii]MTC58686.1 endolytic peptidoglycan transglycosylase RlpA [Providencia rustigianii]SPY76834.1 Rare lipoprotein A precursor [Providencia rustigianii]SUC26062.1 Rare lipoprotein A precursor [Providencia rustigianii]SUC34761.1 Rare lipoprotein A precursor [Providencia rustigianii]
MRLQWIMLAMTATLLSGCVNEDVKQPATVPSNVPTQDVLGAEPHYEPYHPTANNDYQRNGQTYQIVRDPAQFSQVGYAAIYGQEASGHLTAIGERVNPVELTASHPTLPIPSYVRVTNMMNGRMMVVRVNDRGPYIPGKSIALSRAAADRLNLMQTTKIKIDAIQVAPDGSLSGPGSVGSNFVKQSYALPDRPQLGSSPLGTPVMQESPAPANTLPVKQPVEPMQPTMPEMKVNTPEPEVAPQAAAEQPVPERGFLVQAGAISSKANAQSMLDGLKTQFNVPGRLQPYNGIYRVQLGPFSTRQQAVDIQSRLQSEKNQQSMVVAP